MGMFAALWRYRHFIMSSIRGEFMTRYARLRLGLLWSVLNPLAQAAIFALILAEVLGAKLPGVASKVAYPIYLMAGMAAWGLFSEIVNRCLTIFIEYASPLKKIAFPRLCLPIIVLGGALVNHALLLLAIAIVFIFFGVVPGFAWLVLPLGAGLIAIFGFGLGVMLGMFNVFSRDVGQVMSVVLQMWFWLTPIVYMHDMLPANLRPFIELNPMVALVGIYQQALLFDRLPDPSPLIAPTLISCALFFFSFVLFRRANHELIDAL